MTSETSQLDSLVTLRSALMRDKAHILKTTLESYGIPAFLASENMGSLMYGVATDLLVRRGDLPRAQSLLENVSALNLPDRNDDEDGVHCPSCGSSRVVVHTGTVPSILPGITWRAPAEDGWMHCFECKSYWREGGRRFSSLPLALLWGLSLGGLSLVLISIIEWLRWI